MSEPSQLRGPRDAASPSGLVDHYLRHEYGRLVAVLVRRVGLHHLDAVEDAVQGALLAALTAWLSNGIPHDPSAWLYRVAHNYLLGALRKQQGHQRLLGGVAAQDAHEGEQPVPPAFAGEVRDELLRMLFVCCDEMIPQESRLVLALKDTVWLQHRRDCFPPVHQRGQCLQAPGPSPRAAASGGGGHGDASAGVAPRAPTQRPSVRRRALRGGSELADVILRFSSR